MKGTTGCDKTKCEMKDGKCAPSSCGKKENCHAKMGKCDLSKCATMTKDECAKMCDEKGCSAEEKNICLSHYGKDGKWIGNASEKKECCKGH